MQNVDRLSCVMPENGEKPLKEWGDGLTLIMITKLFIQRLWSLCGGFSNNCLRRISCIEGSKLCLTPLGVLLLSVTLRRDRIIRMSLILLVPSISVIQS